MSKHGLWPHGINILYIVINVNKQLTCAISSCKCLKGAVQWLKQEGFSEDLGCFGWMQVERELKSQVFKAQEYGCFKQELIPFCTLCC